MRYADVAVVVTNPEVSSVRDSDRIIGLLDSKTEKAAKGERIEKHLLLTRYDAVRAARGEMLKVDDVLEILSIPLLGIIPESQEVLRASNLGSPVTTATPPARRPGPMSRPRGGCAGETLAVSVPSEPPRLLRHAVRTEGGMNLLQLFQRRSSAPVARERLQVLLAHERAAVGQTDLVARAARGDPGRDRQARPDRPRQGAGQDGPRRGHVDAGDRHRDPDPAAARRAPGREAAA